MKVQIGGSVGMKMMVRQYEPIDVNSTFMIEKEVDDNIDLDELHAELTEKANLILKEDLGKKAKMIIKQQKELNEKIREIL